MEWETPGHQPLPECQGQAQYGQRAENEVQDHGQVIVVVVRAIVNRDRSNLLDKTQGGARHAGEPMAPLDFERLYAEHAQAVFAFLLSLTRHEADTRDLLQEVFVKLARRPDLLRGVRDERAFLLRLAHNLVIDLIRRREARGKHHEQLARESPSIFVPAAGTDEGAFREALAAALGDLPPEQVAVVHLKLWEGLTFDQIAELLHIPLNTAASRYRYGIDKLRERLRPLYEELR